MEKNIPRLLITAINSGSGKTLFTMGLLRLLQNKGLNIASYKCGPDYIDTSFHKKALNLPCRNIDLFLSDINTLKNIISADCDIAIIEGVMGFYDGIAYSSDASSYDISHQTDTPAVLIVDAKGKAATLKAIIYGMLNYKENNIKAVILNKIHKQSYEMYKDIIEKELNIKVAGYLPEIKDAKLNSRHLGLITAEEIKNIDEVINKVAENINEFIDVDFSVVDMSVTRRTHRNPRNSVRSEVATTSPTSSGSPMQRRTSRRRQGASSALDTLRSMK